MTKNTTKKGVTAVVAIVLLLMMTVAAAGLAYMWINQMQTGTQAKTTAQLDTQTQQMQGSIKIESAWIDNTNMILLTIKNTGSTAINDLSTARVYVDGVPGPTLATWANVALGTPLAPGEASNTLTSTEAEPGVGVSKSIRIITSEGIETTYVCRQPKNAPTAC